MNVVTFSILVIFICFLNLLAHVEINNPNYEYVVNLFIQYSFNIFFFFTSGSQKKVVTTKKQTLKSFVTS